MQKAPHVLAALAHGVRRTSRRRSLTPVSLRSIRLIGTSVEPCFHAGGWHNPSSSPLETTEMGASSRTTESAERAKAAGLTGRSSLRQRLSARSIFCRTQQPGTEPMRTHRNTGRLSSRSGGSARPRVGRRSRRCPHCARELGTDVRQQPYRALQPCGGAVEPFRVAISISSNRGQGNWWSPTASSDARSSAQNFKGQDHCGGRI